MIAAMPSRTSIWSWALFQGGRDPYIILITIYVFAPEWALIACGFLAAVTVTAAYSSNRTMLTRVVPADKIGVFFGLFVIAGTATMWLGPMLVELATDASGSQRVGLLPLSGLLAAGLMALSFVQPERSRQELTL